MENNSTKPISASVAEPPQPAADSEVALTLPQVIDLVKRFLSNGHLDRAEVMLGRVFQVLPDDPDALHLCGALRDMQGRPVEALALIERSITLKPDDPGRWNELGNVLSKLDRRNDAIVAYQKSIALAGETQDAAAAYNNLGRMRMSEDIAAAERAFRRATELSPEFAHAFYNLSQVLIELGRVIEGVDACGRAIVLMPQNAPREHVGRALIHLGHTQEAIAHYEKWLAEKPDDPVIQHHLAALLRPDYADRASDGYVEAVFDGFAASFDAKLAQLDYHAPERVCDALRELFPAAEANLDIADAGCGTGLCGPLMKPWARRLCGFDLSGGMLSLAEARADYTDLHKAELVSFLNAHPAAFDVVISADTLCYFGRLNEAIQASAVAVRAGGHVIFTVEALDDDATPHQLLPSGRYAHSLAHVSAVAHEAALQVLAIKRVALRAEGGRPVIGWLVTLIKSTGNLR